MLTSYLKASNEWKVLRVARGVAIPITTRRSALATLAAVARAGHFRNLLCNSPISYPPLRTRTPVLLLVATNAVSVGKVKMRNAPMVVFLPARKVIREELLNNIRRFGRSLALQLGISLLFSVIITNVYVSDFLVVGHPTGQ